MAQRIYESTRPIYYFMTPTRNGTTHRTWSRGPACAKNVLWHVPMHGRHGENEEHQPHKSLINVQAATSVAKTELQRWQSIKKSLSESQLPSCRSIKMSLSNSQIAVLPERQNVAAKTRTAALPKHQVVAAAQTPLVHMLCLDVKCDVHRSFVQQGPIWCISRRQY